MRVFSVPVSVPFLRAVVNALVDGRLVDGFEARSNPARLAEATLYLPTRRALRVAREVFTEIDTSARFTPWTSDSSDWERWAFPWPAA